MPQSPSLGVKGCKPQNMVPVPGLSDREGWWQEGHSVVKPTLNSYEAELSAQGGGPKSRALLLLAVIGNEREVRV